MKENEKRIEEQTGCRDSMQHGGLNFLKRLRGRDRIRLISEPVERTCWRGKLLFVLETINSGGMNILLESKKPQKPQQ